MAAWGAVAPFLLGGLGAGISAATKEQPQGDGLVGFPHSVSGYQGPPAYSGLAGSSLIGDVLQGQESAIAMQLGRLARPLSLAGTAIDPAPLYRGPNMPVTEVGVRSIDPAWLQPELLSRPGLNFLQETPPEVQQNQEDAAQSLQDLMSRASGSDDGSQQSFFSDPQDYFNQYNQQSDQDDSSGQCDPKTVASVNTCAHQSQNVPRHRYWQSKSTPQFSINPRTGACVEECHEFEHPPDSDAGKDERRRSSISPMTGDDDGSGEEDWARQLIEKFMMGLSASGTGPGAATGPQTGAGSDPTPTGQRYSTAGRLANTNPYLYGQQLNKTENVWPRLQRVDQPIPPMHDPKTSLRAGALKALGVAMDPTVYAGPRANRTDPRVDDQGFITSGDLPNVMGGRPNIDGILPVQSMAAETGTDVVEGHSQQFTATTQPDDTYNPLVDPGMRDNQAVGYDSDILGAGRGGEESELMARLDALESTLAELVAGQSAQTEADVQRKDAPPPTPPPPPEPEKPACNAQTVATVNTCAGSPTARRLGWKSYPTPRYGPNRNGECVEHCIHP